MKTAQATDFADETRQQILNAAINRFGHYGYNKTTMAEIAEDIGMSAANLYRYFQNKQDIAAACASNCMCQRVDLLRQAVRKPGLSAVEQLENYVMTTLEDCYEAFSTDTKINEIVAFITNERPDLVHKKSDAQRQLIAEILAYGNETGEFAIQDIPATANAVHSSLVVFDVPLFMTLYSLEEFREKAGGVFSLLLQGLQKRDQ